MFACCTDGESRADASRENQAASTAEEAKEYIESAETELLDLGVKGIAGLLGRREFYYRRHGKDLSGCERSVEHGEHEIHEGAHRFDGSGLTPELTRKRLLLELASGFPAPDDPKAQKELADILASLDGDCGEGKWWMLSLRRSKPWQDALETLARQKQTDATALADYFAPLKKWLDEQSNTKEYPVGW